MTHWIDAVSVEEVSKSGRRLFTYLGQRLAVFHHEGRFFAIDNHCSHRGGPVAAGRLDGLCLTCPWHGMQFHIATGESISAAIRPLTTLPVRVHERQVQVDVSALETSDSDGELDGIRRHLIRFGIGGDVGLFGTIYDVPCRRNERVVVQTYRGEELGCVLHNGLEQDKVSGKPTGELLRLATEFDLAKWKSQRRSLTTEIESVNDILRRRSIAIQIVDAEWTLDETCKIFYFLGTSDEQLGPIAILLSNQGIRVCFQNIHLE